MTRQIILTCSLPYANGPLHLGHIVEYTQADIWTRFQNMRGEQCFYICGSDCHGTPVMIRAQQEGITPEALVTRVREEHMKDFAAFDIQFDNFYTTHSDENRELSYDIYNKLKAKGDISTKTINQFFDTEKNMFLPDRFIKGTCPKCGAEDQYGDNCEVCGATYAPTDLKDPRSVLSDSTPTMKETEHYFFELPNYTDALQKWTHDGHLQSAVANKLDEWFKQGLKAWDITRDAPYFGFNIPDSDNKYFYVWLDAPIGYIASFKNFCETHQDFTVKQFWDKDSTTELYHNIGKDVAYFHTLFWPAMLMSADLRTPTAVWVHGYLTVNGQKMSKSRGTFIKARTYLNHLRPDYLRYYFAAKLNSNVEDIDLNLEDFMQRVNSDLVGKVVNIASRCAGFLKTQFNCQLSANCDDKDLWQEIMDSEELIADCYETREYGKAMREIMRLADIANQYIAEKAPWKMIKEVDKKEQVHDTCTMGINLFRALMIYLKPVTPTLAHEAETFLNIENVCWQDSQHFLTEHRINHFKPLLQRITEEEITAMTEESKQAIAATQETAAKTESPFKDEITIDDFMKLDLRIAEVKTAEAVEGADKLVKLILNVGDVERQVFAGIKAHYTPEELVGKKVVFVANLKPRKMRFGLSEGMVLCASDDKTRPFLIAPEDGATPGTTVR